MDQLSAPFITYVSSIGLQKLILTLTFTVLGLAIAKLASVSISRAFSSRLGEGGVLLIRRFTWYFFLVLIVSNALTQLGVDLTVLLGAAGVLTVAVGFAAQTSAANMISGLFLLGDRPFSVGDLIRFDSTFGTIISIDLPSESHVSQWFSADNLCSTHLN